MRRCNVFVDELQVVADGKVIESLMKNTQEAACA